MIATPFFCVCKMAQVWVGTVIFMHLHMFYPCVSLIDVNLFCLRQMASSSQMSGCQREWEFRGHGNCHLFELFVRMFSHLEISEGYLSKSLRDDGMMMMMMMMMMMKMIVD